MKNEKQKGKMKKWKSNRFARVKKKSFSELKYNFGTTKKYRAQKYIAFKIYNC